MATTINTQVGTFKRIKTQYVAAAAGIALAASALIGGLALQNNGATSRTPSIAPASVSDQTAGSFPLVQEMSHPQVAPLVDAQASDVFTGYPLVQEMSHPVAPVGRSTNSDVEIGSFPLVQEFSHPIIPAAAPSDSTVDVGSYPLVQEMSHPR